MNNKTIQINLSFLFNKESSLSQKDKEKTLYPILPEREKILYDLKNNRLNLGQKCKIIKRYPNDKEIILEAVKQNGYALQFASEKFRDDKEIALEAVKQYGLSLEFTSERLKDDDEIVLEAVKQNRIALYYASKRLKEKFKK